MAVYKVLQDIEAEDKLLGPLTLKQFLFAGVAIGFTFAAFFAATKIGIWAVIPFIPFIAVPTLLAAPLGRDQPTDIWLAAQVRFYLKSRKRIWDQSGIKELVTITAPKRIEKFYTDGLEQSEVKSRLRALADTIDSRGWAVKNIDASTYAAPHFAFQENDDRLIDLSSLPRAVSENDINPSDDIMDASNATYQHFTQMATDNTATARQNAINKMNLVREGGEYKPEEEHQTTKDDLWFLNQPDVSNADPNNLMFTESTINPVQVPKQPESFLQDKPQEITAAEQEILEKIKKDKQDLSRLKNPHHRTIKTPEQVAEDEAKERADALRAEAQQKQPMTPHKNPAIVKEMSTWNDVSIDTISKVAKQQIHNTNDEVVIKLR